MTPAIAQTVEQRRLLHRPLGGKRPEVETIVPTTSAADGEEAGHGYHALGWNASSFNNRIVSPEGASTKIPLR